MTTSHKHKNSKKAFHHKPNASIPIDQQLVKRLEEFTALTKSYDLAVLLNQMMYWTQQTKDFDLMLLEEVYIQLDESMPPCFGWIRKPAEKFLTEIYIPVSRMTMRRYLKSLMDQGWIRIRATSFSEWDKSTEYRVNIGTLYNALTFLRQGLSDDPQAPHSSSHSPSQSQSKERGAKL